MEHLDALRQEIETLDEQLTELLLHRATVTNQMPSFGLGSIPAATLLGKRQEQLNNLLQPVTQQLSGLNNTESGPASAVA